MKKARDLWAGYKAAISNAVVPGNPQEYKDIVYWKNRVFCNITIFFLPISLLALFPGIYMSLREDIPLMGIYDICAFITMVVITLVPGISIEIRKIILVICLYLLSLVLLYYLGSFGPALMYMVAITVICSVIFSGWIGYLSVLLNVFLCIAIAFFIHYKTPGVPVPSDYSLGGWIANSSSLILLNIITTACLQLLIKGFENTLRNRKQVEDKLLLQEVELTEKNRELKELSAYLQRVREEERIYIAREVHDELGQLASALKIDVDWVKRYIAQPDEVVSKRIQHANTTIEIMINSIRKIAARLRPGILDDFGLHAALNWLCAEFQELNDISCVYESSFDDTLLKQDMKTELFRISQESLTNIMRHAEATEIFISTKEDPGMVYLTITDNGNGFDKNQQKNTLGLIGLRERAISLSGSLQIDTAPGKGTTICASIPKNYTL